MHARFPFLLCALTLSGLACQDEHASPPQQPMAGGPGVAGDEPAGAGRVPWAAGGTTSDFGGDCALCAEPEFMDLALDDDERLGFAPDDVLAVVEGVHTATVRWRDACEEGPCQSLDRGCPRAPLPLGGTQTELRIELRRAGTPVLETCPTRDRAWVDAGGYEHCIGTYLHLPIAVEASTADGAFSATIEGEELFIEPGHVHVGFGVSLTPAQLGGSLASELPELESVELSLWFDEQGPGADLYLLGAPAGGRPENLGQLEAAGTPCLVGFPLTTSRP